MEEIRISFLQSGPRMHNTAKVVRTYKLVKNTHTITFSNMTFKVWKACIWQRKKSPVVTFCLLLFCLATCIV